MDFYISESNEVPVEDLDDAFFTVSLEYWRARIGGNFAPSWKDIDLMALPATIIPFVTVVDVVHDPFDFVYRFYGTGHVNAKGVDLTGVHVKQHPQGRGSEVFAEYRKVHDAKRPMAFERTLNLPDSKLPLQQTALRMPLTSDGETVDKIIAVSNWHKLKEYWPGAPGSPAPGAKAP